MDNRDAIDNPDFDLAKEMDAEELKALKQEVNSRSEARPNGACQRYQPYYLFPI